MSKQAFRSVGMYAFVFCLYMTPVAVMAPKFVPGSFLGYVAVYCISMSLFIVMLSVFLSAFIRAYEHGKQDGHKDRYEMVQKTLKNLREMTDEPDDAFAVELPEEN